MESKSLITLAVFLALVFAAASTGMRYLPGTWYTTLAKPAWTPPGWLFGPVWAVLYVMIAVAGWRVYEHLGIGPALGVWAISLALNAAWSPLMFGAQKIGLAAVDIAALWISIAGFIALTWRAEPMASYLFVPYLVWVSYATALNITILRLNPSQA